MTDKKKVTYGKNLREVRFIKADMEARPYAQKQFEGTGYFLEFTEVGLAYVEIISAKAKTASGKSYEEILAGTIHIIPTNQIQFTD